MSDDERDLLTEVFGADAVAVLERLERVADKLSNRKRYARLAGDCGGDVANGQRQQPGVEPTR